MQCIDINFPISIFVISIFVDTQICSLHTQLFTSTGCFFFHTQNFQLQYVQSSRKRGPCMCVWKMENEKKIYAHNFVCVLRVNKIIIFFQDIDYLNMCIGVRLTFYSR